MSLHHLRLAFFSILAFSVLSAPRARAQEDIGALVQQSLDLMGKQQWAAALEISDRIIKEFGTDALANFGPQFGEIHYRKGLCELNLKKWSEAAASFETCYQGFPNKDGAMSQNQFEKRALLKWADAEIGQEQWQEALDLLQKFNREKQPRDKYSLASFNTNMAICYYKLGQVGPGNENFETALKNRFRHPMPDQAVATCLRVMIEATLAAKNEQTLIDFITKNRGELTIDPGEMYHPHSAAIVNMATEALQSEMPRAAMLLYQMVPTTEHALDSTDARLKSLGPMVRVPLASGDVLSKPELENRLENLEKEKRSGHSIEMTRLAATAFLHEVNGNINGAFAAYRQLELYYNHSDNRESNLYNLARTSFGADSGAEGLKYALLFLKDFPNSKQAPEIQRMMFLTLFAQGRYEECIERAGSMINKLKEGTKEHDQCLHVLGGSYFFTQEFEKAAPLLEDHVTKYPDSEQKIAAAYFQAANLFRLQEYAKSGEKLDEFLAKFNKVEENPYYPYAMFDRATCHFYLMKAEECLKVVDDLISRFPECEIIDQVQVLRGNVLDELKRPDEAKTAYTQAIESGRKLGHEEVIGEAIQFMADLIIREAKGDAEKHKEALPYLKDFWDNYSADSPYRRKVAQVQMPVMETENRLDEGLKRLEEVIGEVAKDGDAVGLEEAIPILAEYYLKDNRHTAEQLREYFMKFPNVSPDDKVARVLLRIEIIIAFEDLAKTAKEESAKLAAKTTVDNLFVGLKSDFKVEDMTPSILVKIGNYLRMNTSAPREAMSFYDEAVNREDAKNLHAALLGRAECYAMNKGDFDKAIADFQRVLEDETAKEENKEMALFRIVEILYERNDYNGCAERAKAFLTEGTGYPLSRKAANVHFYLGQSYDKRNMREDAISMYAKVWATYTSKIQFSAPAMKRWMELLWERNQPGKEDVYGDRQGAYVQGAKFIESTQHFKDKMIESDRKLWDEVDRLVQQYEANPDIKSLKQIRLEKERGGQ